MNIEKNWVFFIVPIVVAIVFIFIAVVCITNAINKVECGVVSDKYYAAGYSSGEIDHSGGHYHVEPPRYFVQLEYEGKKFWFEATVDEYKRAVIGEWFER